MNPLINGWSSPNKGDMTSVVDVVIDHICDLKYGLKTCGFERLQTSSLKHHNYRATPYRSLKKLWKACPFEAKDHFVDFGCGKGRVYLYAALCGCSNASGVEYDPDMVEMAKQNQNMVNEKSHANLELLHADAKKLKIENSMNQFFFFTPFHLNIFGHVLKNIKRSLSGHPRKATIIFYRPTPEWIEYMENDTVFTKRSVIKILGDDMFTLYTTSS